MSKLNNREIDKQTEMYTEGDEPSIEVMEWDDEQACLDYLSDVNTRTIGENINESTIEGAIQKILDKQ